MKASQLRASILQQAVEGKLVPQIPEEGTATDLLESIRAEREALIKAGKIKKAKPLPEITEDEIPFEIPESWRWVRLGDVGTWGSGATPIKTNANYYTNGTIPWLLTGDLNDGLIEEIPNKITELALDETSVKLNPIGSVLIAMYGATIGKVGILNCPATTNQACCACQTYSGIYNWYLLYFLLSQRKEFRERGVGGAQPNISKEKIVVTLMPLPPLAEQKRIVAKLEELMPLIDAYEKEEEKLSALEKSLPEKLRRSVLQQAVEGKLVPQIAEEGTAAELLKEIEKERAGLVKEGKMKKAKPLPEISEEEIPFEIPESWEWVRLGDLSINIHYGFTASADVQGNAKLLRITDIQNNSVDWKTVPLCSVNENEQLRYSLNPRDILIARTGGTVGKTYLVKSLPQDITSVFASYLIRFIPLVNIDVDFLKILMESPLYWSQLREKARGTGIDNVNSEELRSMHVVLPPLAEQKRIVAKVEELMQIIDKF